jgi:hypothetical protein
MDPERRVVTTLPLTELWDTRGPVPAARIGNLGRDDVAGRLASTAVRFVVADVGHPLQWISPGDRFQFWKETVRPRVVDPQSDGVRLEDYPGEYCFLASEWRTEAGDTVVLLESYH